MERGHIGSYLMELASIRCVRRVDCLTDRLTDDKVDGAR